MREVRSAHLAEDGRHSASRLLGLLRRLERTRHLEHEHSESALGGESLGTDDEAETGSASSVEAKKQNAPALDEDYRGARWRS